MKILFVCTGNTCRSVLAEGYFRKFIKDSATSQIEVKSCGTAALPTYRVPPVVNGLLKDENIDISGHISTPINKMLVEVSDYIFVMENTHKNEILRRYPEVKKKVFLLKEFANGCKLDESGVPDPIGQPEEVYIKCAGIIKELVQKAFDIINKRKSEVVSRES